MWHRAASGGPAVSLRAAERDGVTFALRAAQAEQVRSTRLRRGGPVGPELSTAALDVKGRRPIRPGDIARRL
jgi:hypothetical protein